MASVPSRHLDIGLGHLPDKVVVKDPLHFLFGLRLKVNAECWGQDR